MRTVFTDSQTKQLEALFELTDYPAVEVRAELARSTGLSEETVRVSPVEPAPARPMVKTQAWFGHLLRTVDIINTQKKVSL